MQVQFLRRALAGVAAALLCAGVGLAQTPGTLNVRDAAGAVTDTCEVTYGGHEYPCHAEVVWDGSGAPHFVLSDTSGRPFVNINGTVSIQGGNSTPVVTDGSGHTQPVSIASLPLPTNAAQETGGNLAAGKIDLDTILTHLGLAPMQATGGVVGISGSLPAFASTPTFNLGSLGGAATAANQPALNGDGGALAHVTDFPSSFGISGSLPAFAATPTFNLGSLGGAAVESGGHLASLDTKTPSLGQGAAAASSPVVLNSDPDYRPGSSSITAADVATTSASGQSGASLITGTPTASSFVTWNLNGQSSATLTVAGTFSATADVEVSYDNGSHYVVRGASLIGATTNTNPTAITGAGDFQYDVTDATQLRVRASAFTSGTIGVQLTASGSPGMTKLLNAVGVMDRTSGNALTIKSASTAAVASDPSVVTNESPNSQLSIDTHTIVADYTVAGSSAPGGPGIQGVTGGLPVGTSDTNSAAIAASVAASKTDLDSLSASTTAAIPACGSGPPCPHDIGTIDIDQTSSAENGVSLVGINATAVSTGNGATNAGDQRVNIASDQSAIPAAGQGADGSASPSGETMAGAKSSGIMTALIQADQSSAIAISSATTTQIIALSAGKKTYITAFDLTFSAGDNFTLEYGTGTNCSTVVGYLVGSASVSAQYAANGGLTKGSGVGPVWIVPASDEVCVVTSSSAQAAGSEAWTQF